MRPTLRPEVERLLATAAKTAAEDKPSPLLGKAAPLFRVKGLKDEPISIESLRGKVVVVDLWATWCEPCVRAFPDLSAVAQQYQKKGVIVLTVNQGEDAADVRAFVAKKKLGSPLRFGVDPDEKAGEALAADGLPHTVVIDRGGIVRAVHSGYSSSMPKELRREIDQALALK